MWLQVDFKLSDVGKHRLFGSPEWYGGRLFRRWTALVNDECRLGLPEALFHYNQDNAIGSMPGVRFGWNAGGLRLMAIGAQGVALVRHAAPIIAAQLIKSSQSLVSCHLREGHCQIALRPMQQMYFSPSLVVSRDREVNQWLALVDSARATGTPVLELEQARHMTADVIRSSILRQLELHVREGSNPFIDEDDEAIFARQRDLRVEVHPTPSRHFLVPAVNSVTTSFLNAQGRKASKPLLGLAHVQFSVNATLTGLWGCGRMLSHGYGCVMPFQRKLQAKAAA